ncbi:MAG TPA: hypothetical protein VI564_03830 [Candidatus Nanoarchaeia archaeon]|nr:hypothetical protein [Candidatus Nanoarchaeia archaeon]
MQKRGKMRKTNRNIVAHRKTGQAALEFLSTYAWAFIVITITLGALYYFGVFDFGKFVPQKCIFPSQFRCLDFSLLSTPTGTIKLRMLNNIGEDVQVTSFTITNDAATPVSCTPPSVPFAWTHDTEQNIEFTSCTGGGYLGGERVELRATMQYYAVNTPSQPRHIISGKINGQVTS